MNVKKNALICLLILAAVFIFPACKAKKLVEKQAPVETEKMYAPAPQPAPAPVPVKNETPAPTPLKPNYNFNKIQFEFNSATLKTGSYQALDAAVAEMKKDISVKFILNGNSSAEGSDQRNMELSIERANSVKIYLVNSGINADNLTVKGYGESKPVADNNTEDGRILNRRVEVKVD